MEARCTFCGGTGKVGFDARVDVGAKVLIMPDRVLRLKEMETDVMYCLVQRAGEWVTLVDLEKWIYGARPKDYGPQAIRSTMAALRKRLMPLKLQILHRHNGQYMLIPLEAKR